MQFFGTAVRLRGSDSPHQQSGSPLPHSTTLRDFDGKRNAALVLPLLRRRYDRFTGSMSTVKTTSSGKVSDWVSCARR